jgi:hypothetical protein
MDVFRPFTEFEKTAEMPSNENFANPDGMAGAPHVQYFT